MAGRKEEIVVEIGEDNFLQEVIESDLPVVVDCSASWCLPCVPMSHIMDRLAQEYQGKVKFYKLDVDKNTELADKLKVKSVPTLLFFRNNRVNALVGLASEDKLRSTIDQFTSPEGIERGFRRGVMKQHPLFIKYRRDWLCEVTGYSKVYLSRVATGNITLSRSFVERVCFKLKLPEEELFLPMVEDEVKFVRYLGEVERKAGRNRQSPV